MKAAGLVGLAGLALLLNGCFPSAPDDGVCGDGQVNTVDGEECDNGFSENSETPNAACRTNCLPQRCGDGVKDDGEQCDLGGENSDSVEASCSLECKLMRCGDGIADPGEACDDGNIADGGGCESTCMWPEWQSFTTANTDGGLMDNDVRDIAIDSAGGKWFGANDWDSSGGGVSYWAATFGM